MSLVEENEAPLNNELYVTSFSQSDMTQSVSEMLDVIQSLEAVELPEDLAERKNFHRRLGHAYLSCSKITDDLQQLHKALHHLNMALELVSHGHPECSTLPSSAENMRGSLNEENSGSSNKPISDCSEIVAQTAEPPENPTELVGIREDLALAHWSYFKKMGDVEHLHQTIHHLGSVVDVRPAGDPDEPHMYDNLGSFHQTRFERLGNINDIDQALNHYNRAVELTPDGRPNKPSRHLNLGNSFLTRFQRLGNVDDLNQALNHRNHAVELTPEGHPNMSSLHNNLGNSFLTRFQRLGDIDDLDQALDHHSRAIELIPEGHPDKASRHHNLRNSFLTRFHRLGNIDDLNQALGHHNRAVELTPDGHPTMSSLHNNLGNSFLTRFRHLGDIDNLDQALYHRNRAMEMIPEGHPDRLPRHHNLGNSFLTRFERLGDIDDLNQALDHHNRAVELTPEGHLDKSSRHHNLGNSFLTRFERLGDINDLNQALDHHNRAVELTPEGHPDKPSRYHNLGNSFLTRFHRLGNIDDLNQALDHHNRAVGLTPEGHPNMSSLHNNLGNSLLTRFRRLGDIDSLDQALYHHKHAMELIPEGHPDKLPRHHNLGNSFLTRFERLGDIDDLNQALDHHNRAVELTPEGHPDKPSRHHNLGNSFLTRFERLGDINDLNQALDHHNRAVELTPEGHPDEPLRYHNLGSSFHTRFERFGDIADLEESISQYQRGVDLTPPNHPRSLTLSLAISQSLSERLRPGDLISALFLCIIAARHISAPRADRLQATKQWAKYLHQLHGQLVPSAYDCYAAVICELPHISWIGVPVSARFHQLLQATSVGSDAAAAALCAGKPEVSLEWLEQTRSVVWAQIVQMRTPLTDLLGHFPTLRNRLSHIWSKLDADGSSLTSEQRTNLAAKSDRLLEEIRAKPGFSRFLLPREFTELQTAARSGPIVILNASRYRCDAFILLSSSIQVVSLDHCNLTRLRDIQSVFMKATSNDALCQEDPDCARYRVSHQASSNFQPQSHDKNSIFRLTLNFLWSCVAQPCLAALIPVPPLDKENLLHVRWCPTGLFAFLPIHAATEFGENNEVLSRLADKVVSSYVPTLGTLLEPKRCSNLPVGANALAIIQSATPDQSQLPGAKTELNRISQRATEAGIALSTLSDRATTVLEVLTKVPEYSVVHFACHGVQDLKDPLNSGLFLDDGRLTLQKLIHTKLPIAQLAFLSASETAKSEEKQPDQAVHVAAGMLAAGFRDVIGTMWSISDDAAPIVADLVYAEVFKDGKLLVDRIPFALHHAIEHLRAQNPNNFTSWMPFIHLGP